MILSQNSISSVSYEGYELYCSYEEIIGAIETWGKVEAVWQKNNGWHHAFLVRFNKPIKLYDDGHDGTPRVNLASGGVFGTPFLLRDMWEGTGHSSRRVTVLSENMMLFDIHYLQVGTFDCDRIMYSHHYGFTDGRIGQLCEEVRTQFPHRHQNEERNKALKEKIDQMFSHSMKAQKLLDWIKMSGQKILERGLAETRYCDNPIREYSVSDIFAQYTAHSWDIVKRDE